MALPQSWSASWCGTKERSRSRPRSSTSTGWSRPSGTAMPLPRASCRRPIGGDARGSRQVREREEAERRRRQRERKACEAALWEGVMLTSSDWIPARGRRWGPCGEGASAGGHTGGGLVLVVFREPLPSSRGRVHAHRGPLPGHVGSSLDETGVDTLSDNSSIGSESWYSPQCWGTKLMRLLCRW